MSWDQMPRPGPEPLTHVNMYYILEQPDGPHRCSAPARASGHPQSHHGQLCDDGRVMLHHQGRGPYRTHGLREREGLIVRHPEGARSLAIHVARHGAGRRLEYSGQETQPVKTLISEGTSWDDAAWWPGK